MTAPIPLSKSVEALRQIERDLKLLDERRRYRRIDFFRPYPKQQEFFDAGSRYDERMLSAGNQQGKTEAGAAEMTYHLTGEYPDDWLGRKWDRPITAWVCGESTEHNRDVLQEKLCGEPGVEVAWGSGLIPRDNLVGKSMARGIVDAIDTLHVRHKSGGISTLKFKSYEQGRSKFQGKPVDLVWGDEEPDMDVYTEMLARIAATNGSIFITFTPLKGITELWERFNAVSKYRYRVVMAVKDALHFDTPEKIAKLLERYPTYQHATRLSGQPMMGEGQVFLTPEDNLKEPTLTYIPAHWTKLFSIDFGIGHPFGCTLQLWDRDNDVIHIHEAWKIADQTPVQHAMRMKQIGIMVPVAWPQDGTAREKSGETVSKLYKDQGLKMCDNHATFEDGGYGTEAGVLEMDERMKTGRLRVNAALGDWFEEYRGYHRKNGLIVKERDDIMSATRIGIMAKRFGRPVQLGNRLKKRRDSGIADGVDFDPF